MRHILKFFICPILCSVALLLSSCSSSPQITMDPIKDAQTCIKLYEKDIIKGEAYMQDVTVTYYMQSKHSEHDKFISIVTEKIARISLP